MLLGVLVLFMKICCCEYWFYFRQYVVVSTGFTLDNMLLLVLVLL